MKHSAIQLKNLILVFSLIVSILPFSNFAISGAHLRSCHQEIHHHNESNSDSEESLIQIIQIFQNTGHQHHNDALPHNHDKSCSCSSEKDHQHRSDCTYSNELKSKSSQAGKINFCRATQNETPAKNKIAGNGTHQTFTISTGLIIVKTACLII